MTTDVATLTDPEVSDPEEPNLSDDDTPDPSENPDGEGDDTSEDEEQDKGKDAPVERTVDEIRAAYNDPNGTITSAELRRMEEHDQSIRDRLKVVDDARAKLAGTFDAHTDNVLADIEESLNDAGLALSPSQRKALQTTLKGRTSEVRAAAENAATANLRAGLESDLLQLRGNTPQNKLSYAQLDMSGLLRELYGAVYDAGRKAGPDDNHVVLTKAELTAKLKAAGNGGKEPIKGAKGGSESAKGALTITKSMLNDASPEQVSDWLDDPRLAAQINKLTGAKA